MRPEDYPAQEPFSPPARLYHDEVMKRGASVIEGKELSYGADPYQSVTIWNAQRCDDTAVGDDFDFDVVGVGECIFVNCNTISRRSISAFFNFSGCHYWICHD